MPATSEASREACTRCEAEPYCVDFRCRNSLAACQTPPLTGDPVRDADAKARAASCSQIVDCFTSGEASLSCFCHPPTDATDDASEDGACTVSCRELITRGSQWPADQRLAAGTCPALSTPAGVALGVISECFQTHCGSECFDTLSPASALAWRDDRDAGSGNDAGVAAPPPPFVFDAARCRSCVMERASNDACEEYRTCAGAAAQCVSDASSTPCGELLECVRATDCARRKFSDCLCGMGVSTDECWKRNFEAMTGPCRTLMAAAAGTTDPARLRDRLQDLTYPTGTASAVVSCDRTSCPTECGLDRPGAEP